MMPPMPAYELLEVEKYNRLTVQTSRGCPFQCEFCRSSVLLTSRYKQKPVARVLAEIDRIRQLWRRPFIEFADDNAFVNHRYWKELLPVLKRRHVRWFAETDLSIHEDDELLDLMRQSGCAEVLIGFESPGEWGLRYRAQARLEAQALAGRQGGDRGSKRTESGLMPASYSAWTARESTSLIGSSNSYWKPNHSTCRSPSRRRSRERLCTLVSDGKGDCSVRWPGRDVLCSTSTFILSR